MLIFRVGTISISLKKNADGLLVLDYGDDGIGVPEGMNIRNSKTLGTSIIINITERQL